MITIKTVCATSVGLPPTELKFVVISNATSILLTWQPPSPLVHNIGYRISYTNSSSNRTVDVSGGSTNSYTLTGLSSGETYRISILGKSHHIFSKAVEFEPVTLQNAGDFTCDEQILYVYLYTCHTGLEVHVTSKATNSISLSWSVAVGSFITSEVTWRAVRDSSDSGKSVNQGSSGHITSKSYTIDNLEKETVYI